MHYYKFNIGDYASHTRHLSLMEDLAYRRLLDAAYSSEKPLTKDIHALSRLIGMRDYQSEVADVLAEFFDEVEEGWIHGRVLQEMEESLGRSDKAKVAAQARWERQKDAKAMLTHCLDDATSIKDDATSKENDATHNTLHITHNTQYTDSFMQFWNAYPSKVGKSACLAIWKKKKPQIELVLQALEWQKKSKRWLDGYIPNPSTYLNQGRWEDEPEAGSQPKKAWE